MVISKYLTEEWYLLGRPWVDSEFAGLGILAGDEDPHRGTYLFSVDNTDDIDDDAAREIAAHLVDVHNRALAEGNKLTHLWLDKLRAEQRRVGMLENQLAKLLEKKYQEGQLDQAKLELQGRDAFLADFRSEIEGYKTTIKGLKHDLQTAKDALQELCRLKLLKDMHGKTPEYERDQPKAWQVAFSIVPPPQAVNS